MARAIGIGGIFWKVADPQRTNAWYAEHLGFEAGDFGHNFSSAAGDVTVVAI